ncbi:MAG: VWA domain-containing protein [Candidatus Helarchaeota archaeon]
MLENIVEFIQLLRNRGVRISIAETRDAIDSLMLSSDFMKNPRTFRHVLTTTLVKDQKDLSLFNVLFNQFFFGRNQARIENFFNSLQEDREGSKDDELEIDMGDQDEDLLLNMQALNASLIDQTENNVGDQEKQWEKSKNAKSKARVKSQTVTRLFSKLRRDELMRLSQDEFESHEKELRALIKELGKKIATKITARYTKGKEILDFRKTIHQNIKHGGALVKIVSKKKKIAQPRLLGLIDISDSCQMYYFFMFYLIFMIKKQFSHVRIYEFDSDILEITPALEKETIEDARQEIVKIWDRSDVFKMRNFMKTHSNYDTVFQQFLEKISPILTKKTTVLILGDCRDYLGVKNQNCMPETCSRGCIHHVPNGKCNEKNINCRFCNCRQVNNFPRSATHLRELVRKAKQVIIFNPEKETFWNIGDSVAYCYQNVGAEVYSINDINSLAELVYHRL